MSRTVDAAPTDQIDAGSSTGEIETRYRDTDYAVTFTQTDDDSFNAADTGVRAQSNLSVSRSPRDSSHPRRRSRSP